MMKERPKASGQKEKRATESESPLKEHQCPTEESSPGQGRGSAQDGHQTLRELSIGTSFIPAPKIKREPQAAGLSV
jgi:hypothetical protein